MLITPLVAPEAQSATAEPTGTVFPMVRSPLIVRLGAVAKRKLLPFVFLISTLPLNTVAAASERLAADVWPGQFQIKFPKELEERLLGPDASIPVTNKVEVVFHVAVGIDPPFLAISNVEPAPKINVAVVPVGFALGAWLISDPLIVDKEVPAFNLVLLPAPEKIRLPLTVKGCVLKNTTSKLLAVVPPLVTVRELPASIEDGVVALSIRKVLATLPALLLNVTAELLLMTSELHLKIVPPAPGVVN
jgi:hypothetical protein